MPRSIRVRSAFPLILVTLFVALSSQASGAGHLSANDEETGLTAALPTGKAPERGRISRDLLDLAAWAERIPPSANFEQALSAYPEFSDSAITLVEDRVIIDFVVEGDGAALRRRLETLGLADVTQFGRVISGALPVKAIRALIGIDGIISATTPMPQLHTGSVGSQGDKAQQSELARALHGVTGAGVTIGVLSDSYNCLGGAAADIASGDLPDDVLVLAEISNCGNGSDEGRAMLQIIHDVAPDADLVFHTAFDGMADFAQGIIDLADAGADIIVDDVSYANEPMFQDGIIAQAVDQVVAGGVAYFSSAGNNSRRAYAASYADDGVPTRVSSIPYLGSHDFDPGPDVDTCLSVAVPAGGRLQVMMQWDEPSASAGGPGAQSDLDIFVYGDGECSSSGSPIDFGATDDINGNPFEITSGDVTNGGPGTAFVGIRVHRFTVAAPTVFKLQMWASSSSFAEHQTDSGTVFGHANAAGAEAVGAAFYGDTPGFGQSPPLLEPFSSAGPMPVFFDADGDRLASPDIRQKPEIVAPDGADTTFFGADDPSGTGPVEANGFPNFFGTSAAAPHAAAAAALLLEIDPAMTPAELYDALESTAIDMDAPGVDDDTGFGLINVEAAAVQVVGMPVFTFTGPFAIEENSPGGTAAGTVTATDPNEGDVLTFAETPGGAGADLFDIDPASGEITVQELAVLDREAAESVGYDIEVTDGENIVSAMVTINLDGVNDNDPVFTFTGPFSLGENSPAGTVVGTVAASDPDVEPVDELAFSEVSEGTGADVFDIDPVTGEITVQDAATLDRETAESLGYAIEVSDGEHTVTGIVTIDLDGVSDNPPVADAQSVDVAHNLEVVITLTGSDADLDPADTLTFSIVTEPANGSLSAITLLNATSAQVTYTPDDDYTGADSFTFEVNDGTATSAPAVVDITVLPNDPPAFTTVGPFTIEENSSAGTPVGAVAAADAENDTLTFSETPGGAGSSTFGINLSTGEITVEDPAELDREAGELVSYDIAVSDGLSTVTTAVTVTLTGVNDNSPQFTFSGPFSLPESSAAGTPVGTVTAEDADISPAQILAFAEVPGAAGAALFNIDSATGQITVEDASAFTDRETVESELFTYSIEVSDGPNTTTVIVTVDLDGMNDNAPSFDFSGPFEIDENSAAGTPVGAVTVIDADIDPQDTITYAEVVGGEGADIFDINPATGEITVENPAALDKESLDSLSYQIRMTDGIGDAEATVTINIIGVNDNAPVFTFTGPFEVDEASESGTSEGTVVGTVTAADADVDPADTLTFSEVPDAPYSAGFEIDPFTGEITVGSNTSMLDRDDFEFFPYQIQVSDGLNTVTATVIIDLDGVNDTPPSFTATGPFQIEENSVPGTVVGAVTAMDSDEDPEDVLTFLEVAGGAGAGTFAIDPQTGEISVQDPAALDREEAASLSYDIAVFDGIHSTQATVTVNLIDVNDVTPVADDRSLVTSHDQDAAITLTVSDGDVGSGNLTFAIVTPPVHGTLSAITQLSPTSARVTYTPDPGFTGPDSFTFAVSDGVNTSLPVTVIIDVRNEAPVFTVTGPFEIAENPGEGVVRTVDATDPEGDALTFAEVPGGDGESIFEISSSTGEITVEDPAALDREAAASLSYEIQVSDGLNIATATITVNIIGVNDNAPVTGAETVVTDEDSPLIITLTATDADVAPANTLTFSIITPPSGGSLSEPEQLSPTSAQVTYTPPPGFTGADSFEFQTSDGENTSGLALVNITVTPNAAPEFTDSGPFAIEENSAAGTAVGTVTATDIDNDTLTFSEISGGAGEGVFSIDPSTGEVTVQDPATLDREAVNSLSYEIAVSDGLKTALATITINLNGVNDNAPAANAQSVTVTQGNAVTITLTGSDADIDPADTLTFSIVTEPVNGSLSEIILLTDTTVEVTYTPGAGFTGDDSFQFTVNDGSQDSAPATVSINVQPQSTGGGGGGFTPMPTPTPAPPPGPSVPSVPRSVTAVPGDGSVTISWMPPASDGGSPVTGYRILNLSSGQSHMVSAPATDALIGGLENGTTYSFQLQAVNSAGAGASVLVGPVTPFGPPSAPSDVQAALNQDGSVSVTWSAPASDGGSQITGYVVSLADGTDLATVGAGGPLAAHITGLAPGISYSFVVSAVNSAGQGEPSAPAGPVLVRDVSEAPEDPPSESAILITQDSETVSALQDAVDAAFGEGVSVPDRPLMFDTQDGAQSILIELESDGGVLPAPDEFNVVSEQLTVQTGSPGRATFSIVIGDGLAITGTAGVSVNPDGVLLNIEQSALEYSPAMTGDAGALGWVSFSVVLMNLPPGAALTAGFSTDLPEEIAGAVLQIGGSGEGWMIVNPSADVAGVVVVSKTGISDSDLGGNTVSMSVSAQWYEQQTGEGKRVVITKISDSGEVFTEPALCSRSGGQYVCVATFSGTAGGFSTFVLSGVAALAEPTPTVTPAPATPMAVTTPAPTPTTSAQLPSVNAVTSTPAPSPSPSPLLEPTIVPPLDMPMSDDDGFPVWGWVVVGAFGLIGARAAWYVFARGRA